MFLNYLELTAVSVKKYILLGVFVFADLMPSAYRVFADTPGFRVLVRKTTDSNQRIWSFDVGSLVFFPHKPTESVASDVILSRFHLYKATVNTGRRRFFVPFTPSLNKHNGFGFRRGSRTRHPLRIVPEKSSVCSSSGSVNMRFCFSFPLL